MITGQYGQAWEIYEALQREYEKDGQKKYSAVVELSEVCA